jgi:hypothetical protein
VGLEGDEQLTLLETARKSEKYADLSHCWGTGNMLKIARDSLYQLAKHIDWALLLWAFQDALTVTPKLSIQSLWIGIGCMTCNSVFEGH